MHEFNLDLGYHQARRSTLDQNRILTKPYFLSAYFYSPTSPSMGSTRWRLAPHMLGGVHV